MARRLYSVGLFHEVRRSKSSGTDSCSSPICLRRIEHDNMVVEPKHKQDRHSSTPSVISRYPLIPRSNNNSAAGLTLQMQSMKKSAFKMLCKYEDKLGI
jgi:hypothetical protein